MLKQLALFVEMRRRAHYLGIEIPVEAAEMVAAWSTLGLWLNLAIFHVANKIYADMFDLMPRDHWAWMIAAIWLIEIVGLIRDKEVLREVGCFLSTLVWAVVGVLIWHSVKYALAWQLCFAPMAASAWAFGRMCFASGAVRKRRAAFERWSTQKA